MAVSDLSGVGGPYAPPSTSVKDVAKKTKDPYDFQMQDFFTLMIAQMQNQNMFESVDDSQFMAQMAQFSSLNSMQQLNAAFISSSAVSYVGKYAKAEDYSATGVLVEREGTITAVNFNGGEPMALIGDTWFALNKIYEVHNEAPKATETDTTKTGTTETGNTGNETTP